ncbi:hypothetical protein D6D24_03942 [Aureobasidium pullulans]|uniref:Uncharacterized protein n=1 Tax=Aureobasidium pullulans TaxID=5580 RepID=A0A4S8W0B9_AURPU|nr:hypothetical protein D6D24_03942 [Aureobasidium pullulans]
MTDERKRPHSQDPAGNDGPPPAKKAKKVKKPKPPKPPSRAARKMAPKGKPYTEEDKARGHRMGKGDRRDMGMEVSSGSSSPAPSSSSSSSSSEPNSLFDEPSPEGRPAPPIKIAPRTKMTARKSAPPGPGLLKKTAARKSITPGPVHPAAIRPPSSGTTPAAHPDAMEIDVQELDVQVFEKKILENDEPLSDSITLRALEEMVAKTSPLDLTLRSSHQVPQFIVDQGPAASITYWRYSNLFIPGEVWGRVPKGVLPAGAEQPWRDFLAIVRDFFQIFYDPENPHPARLTTFIPVPACRQQINFEIVLTNPSFPSQEEREEKDFPLPTHSALVVLLRLWQMLECNKPANHDRIRVTYVFKNGDESSMVKENPKFIANDDGINDYFNKDPSTKKEIDPQTGIQQIYQIAIARALQHWTRYLNGIANTHYTPKDFMNWIAKRTIFSLHPDHRTDRQCGYTKYFFLRQLDKKPQTITKNNGVVELKDKSLQRYVESTGNLKHYLEMDPVEYSINKYNIQPEVEMFGECPDKDWDEVLKDEAGA